MCDPAAALGKIRGALSTVCVPALLDAAPTGDTLKPFEQGRGREPLLPIIVHITASLSAPSAHA